MAASWPEYLDQVEESVRLYEKSIATGTTPSVEIATSENLGPLPEELMERATELLRALNVVEARFTQARDSVATLLAATESPKPRQIPYYVDTEA